MNFSKEQQEKKHKERVIAEKFLSCLGNKHGENYCIIDGDRERPDFLIKNIETDKEIGLEIFELVDKYLMRQTNTSITIKKRYMEYLKTSTPLVNDFLEKFRNRSISIIHCSNIPKKEINKAFFDSMFATLLKTELHNEEFETTKILFVNSSKYSVTFAIDKYECDPPMLYCDVCCNCDVKTTVEKAIDNKIKAVNEYKCQSLFLIMYFYHAPIFINGFKYSLDEHLKQKTIPKSVDELFLFDYHSGGISRLNK